MVALQVSTILRIEQIRLLQNLLTLCTKLVKIKLIAKDNNKIGDFVSKRGPLFFVFISFLSISIDYILMVRILYKCKESG